MFWKNLVYKWLFTVIISITVIVFITCIVDPVNIIGSPIINGFNHFKVKEGDFLDINKLYQYHDIKPDVVFIGSSRIYVGIDPKIKKNSFNFGQSGLSIKNLKNYINFIVKVHKPRKVYIGLDFFQFDKDNYNFNNNNFEQKRLDYICKFKDTPLMKILKIYDSIPFVKYVPVTINESIYNVNTGNLFYYGADYYRGKNSIISQEGFYGFLNHFVNLYKNWEYEEKTLEDLSYIILLLNRNNIETKIFFNPISADLYNALYLSNKIDDFNKIKMELTKLTEFYDFSYINDFTSNRNYFYDSSHYNMKAGEIVIDCIDGTMNSEIFYRCNKNNIIYVINKEMLDYEKWKEDNFQYYRLTYENIINNKYFKKGDLRNFWGF